MIKRFICKKGVSLKVTEKPFCPASLGFSLNGKSIDHCIIYPFVPLFIVISSSCKGLSFIIFK